MRALVAATLLVLLSTGCEIGSRYVRPQTEFPAEWRFKDSSATSVADTTWWKQFHDTVLSSLISEALRNNPDVRIAEAREEEFLGTYWTTRASFFPVGGYAAQAGRTRVSPNAAMPPPKNPTDNFLLGFNASWQIDIWGKLRRATEAARADYLATAAAHRAVALTLVATVAGAYINLLDLDLQLDIANRTAKSREDSYNLFLLQFQRGIISELQLYQAESEWEQAQATIAPLKRDIARQENSLSIILGRVPGYIERGETMDSLLLPNVPTGIPCSLLVHRPDIVSAEEELKAAHARVAVARAYFLPSIDITGVFGWASTQLTNLLVTPSLAWNYSANFAGLFFSGGAGMGMRKTASAVQEQALLSYRRSILTALGDVENALVTQQQTRLEMTALQKQVNALRNADHFARLRYSNGYTSYIEVLDAERSLFAAQVTLAQVQGQLALALVNVYTSLGGGWHVGTQK